MEDEEVPQGNVDHIVCLLPRLDRDTARNHLRHRGLGLLAPGAWNPLQRQLLLPTTTTNPILPSLHRTVLLLPRSLEDDRQQEYD